MFQSAVIQDEFEFTNHNSALNAVSYNRHQDTFVSVDETCLKLWRSHAGGQLRHVNLPSRTSRFIQTIIYIDLRQLFVASALDGTLRLYDPNLNELAALFTSRSTVLSMVFDPLHSRLLTGGVDGCSAWQIKPRPSGMPEGALNAQYEFTSLPKFFHDNLNRNKATNQQPKSSAFEKRIGWVESLQLNSDCRRLYAQTRHWIDVYHTMDGVHLDRWDELFPADYGTLTAFVVQERAKYLVCGTSSGVLVVLSHSPISIVHVFKDHTQSVTSLTEHTTSRLVISSSLDGSIRLWDLETRQQAHRLNVGQAVHALQLLPPASVSQGFGSRPSQRDLAGRFCCQLRNTIKIYSIQSILKEHQPCLVPISTLQRVVFPIKSVQAKVKDVGFNHQIQDEFSEKNSDSDDDIEDSNEPISGTIQQLVVVVCMDKTVRVFPGRRQNEAPSFTWIPNEQALDLVAFALHPVSQHLYLLLSSQKLLIVNAAPHRTNQEFTDTENTEFQEVEATTSRIERVIDLNPSVFSSSEASTCSTGNPRGKGDSGEALRCLCMCPFPPIFNETPSNPVPISSTTRRRQSQIGIINTPAPRKLLIQRRNTLIDDELEWVACGSDYGEVLFWHSGLHGGREPALSFKAHDAPIVDISASASSPLLVTLDTLSRVYLWHLQPQFVLRHVLNLGQAPSVFALSPFSEIILSGYDDGHVVLHAVGYKKAIVEAFTGGDDHHDTTVNAGDFLDEKNLVLTVSVDAIVKVWDQQRVLLRQVTLATAVSSLCFLNADGDLLAGLSEGTFLIFKRDVLPDKLPKPAPPRRMYVNIQTPKTEDEQRVIKTKDVLNDSEPAPSNQQILASDDTTTLLPQKAIFVASRPPDPDMSAKQLLAHVIQRPIDAATNSRPPVLRSLGSKTSSFHLDNFTTNSSEGQLTARVSVRRNRIKVKAQVTIHNEDWRDMILPLPAYQKLMHAPQNGLLYRRKRSQTPSFPLLAHKLKPSQGTASTKEKNEDRSENSAGVPPILGLEVETPLLYCKHQAPVPPKDKTPRKLWNAIGGEDRRLIVLQRNPLPS